MLRYRKPNLIQSDALANFLAESTLLFVTDERNGNALKLHANLNGALIVTFNKAEIYRGSDIDAAVAAFNDAF
jgi:hypothetical protein